MYLGNNLIKQYLLLIFVGTMKKERKKYKKLKKKVKVKRKKKTENISIINSRQKSYFQY